MSLVNLEERKSVISARHAQMQEQQRNIQIELHRLEGEYRLAEALIAENPELAGNPVLPGFPAAPITLVQEQPTIAPDQGTVDQAPVDPNVATAADNISQFPAENPTV